MPTPNPSRQVSMRVDKPILIISEYPNHTRAYIYTGLMDISSLSERIMEETNGCFVSAIQFCYWDGLVPVGHNLQTGEMIRLSDHVELLAKTQYIQYHHPHQLRELRLVTH